MLFQRSKDKDDGYEEDSRAKETDSSEEKIVIGSFQDELAYKEPNERTAMWPTQLEIGAEGNSSRRVAESTEDFSLGVAESIRSEDEWEQDSTVSLTQEHFEDVEVGEEAMDVEQMNNYSLADEVPTVVRTQPSVAVSNLGLSVAEDLQNRFGKNIKSALGPGTVIEGKFSFDSPVCIDGTLSGDIKSSSVLIVGEEATVTGSIEVGSLIVLGTVNGAVEAEELIEVRNGGILEADIQTKRICMEDGAWFSGRCTME